MIALLGSIFGGLMSAIPHIIDYFQKRQDNQHELNMLDRQIEWGKIEHANKMEEIAADYSGRELLAIHDEGKQNSGVPWIDGFKQLPRPMIAVTVFGMFVALKVCVAINFMEDSGTDWTTAVPYLFDQYMEFLLSSVISYYFGDRTFMHLRGQGRG